MKRIFLIFFSILLLTATCKKEEPGSSRLPTIRKENIGGFYIIQEPQLKTIREAAKKAAESTEEGYPSDKGLGCSYLDLNKNELRIFFPLSKETFTFTLGDEFNYKEYKDPSQEKEIYGGKIEFTLKTPGKSVHLEASDKGDIRGDFGVWLKRDSFAGNPLKSVEDCGKFPATVNLECKNGIRKGVYYINAKEGSALRSESSFDADSLEKIPYGTSIQVTETQGQWGKTEFKGKTGFVFKDSYDESPICYSESLSLKKIFDFTTLYNTTTIEFPQSLNITHVLFTTKSLFGNKESSKYDYLLENQLGRFYVEFLFDNYDYSVYSFEIKEIDFQKDKVRIDIDYGEGDSYESPNEREHRKYSCFLDKADLLKLSPWNPKIEFSGCALR